MAFKFIVPNDFAIELSAKNDKKIIRDAHFHDCYELYYLVYGNLTYFVDNHIYSLQKGDIMLIPPHTIHKTQVQQDTQVKRILIYMTEKYVQEFLTQREDLLSCFHTYFLRLDKQRKQKIQSILNQLLIEDHPVKEKDHLMIKSLLVQLLILIARHLKTQDFKAILPPTDAQSEKILEVVRYINANYAEDLHLNGLAKMFYMNPSYLSRTFKKVIGMTYSQYLNGVRIKQAIHLLLNSDANATDIAIQIGFNSDNHFCKTFKSIVGTSPIKYRKAT